MNQWNGFNTSVLDCIFFSNLNLSSAQHDALVTWQSLWRSLSRVVICSSRHGRWENSIVTPNVLYIFIKLSFIFLSKSNVLKFIFMSIRTGISESAVVEIVIFFFCRWRNLLNIEGIHGCVLEEEIFRFCADGVYSVWWCHTPSPGKHSSA